MISLARLAEAEKVIANATPGPWALTVEMDGDSPADGGVICIHEIGRALHDHDWAEPEDWPRDLANAEFMVVARTLLPDLIALVQALGTLGPELREFVARVERVYPEKRTPMESAAYELARQVQALIPKGE